MNRTIPTLLILACILAGPDPAGAQRSQAPPDNVLSPPDQAVSVALRRALESPGLSDDQKRRMRIEHGLWTDADLATPADRAAAMLIIRDFDDPVWSDDSIPTELRARRLVEIGQCADAIRLLEGADSLRACLIRARALHNMGRAGEADKALDPLIDAQGANALNSIDEKVDAAAALALRARLRGQPGSQYHAILAQTGNIYQNVDRLNWTARLVEAQILAEKDNPDQAAAAIDEILQLNPRCAQALALMAHLQIETFNFAAAEQVIEKLRKLSPNQLDADLATIELDLAQSLADDAQIVVDRVLARFPRQREALAFHAAVGAVRYDEDACYIELEKLDQIAPGTAQGYYVCGKLNSMLRQYDLAARLLSKAVQREPNWPAPQIELGLLYFQSGDDARAIQALRKAAALDPFNVRCTFSLHLVESLADYQTIQSEHFVIRFDPESTDRALADEMLEPMEKAYREVTAALQHEPDRRTLIELLPTHSRFAVRITGVPDLHTIAACTGPVIAMESPRQGPDHFGTYDWQRVLRHEFVHTVTLSQTLNRIPHWLTEAAAVWQEQAPRDFATTIQLSKAWHARRLFDLDEINWAFIRPQRPGDRGLAYAQGHWMLEYMIDRYGHDAFIDLLEDFALGLREEIALPSRLGVGRRQFYEEFLVWAGDQLAQWGLNPSLSFEELVSEYKRTDPDYLASVRDATNEAMRSLVRSLIKPVDGPASDPVRRLGLAAVRARPYVEPDPKWDEAAVKRWLARYPDHPDLLRMLIDVHRQVDPLDPDLLPYLQRYAAARPVDPLSDQLQAAILLQSGDRSAAIAHLETLDRLEKYDNAFAVELARLYRDQRDFRASLNKFNRALTIDPFDAALREEAAAVAIQAGLLDQARRHLVALTIIEPDRPYHKTRLEALDRVQGTQN